MIALDTNVLVRLLVQDDLEQVGLVEDFLRAQWSEGEKALVTDLVLAEVAWVLRSTYEASRGDISKALALLLNHPHLVFEDRAAVESAAAAFAKGRGDLADYLIGARGAQAGARFTATLDRGLRRHPHFHYLGPDSPARTR